VRRLCADRHSSEARRLYEALVRVAEGRSSDEAVVARALVALMTGGLAAFGGSTVDELVDLVHAAVDRSGTAEATTATALSAEALSAIEGALQIPSSDRSRTRTALQLRAIRVALDRPPSRSERRATQSRV
jgi:hypothetical protein